MSDTNEYYLYQGNVYHCSECTTEAEMYGADCFYGYGKTLLFLDELEGGNYVNADDCVKVKAPDFTIWQRLRIWFHDDVYLKAIRTKNKFKDLFRTKYDDIPFDDCEF